MVTAKKINIEVAYADVNRQQMISLELDAGCTIETAIDRSGILLLFPDIDLHQQKIGVFSQPKKLTDLVFEGDRIEIYRPLTIDPKEARKKRVKKNVK